MPPVQRKRCIGQHAARRRREKKCIPAMSADEYSVLTFVEPAGNMLIKCKRVRAEVGLCEAWDELDRRE
ncbi:Uncharacterized protein MCB1EB_0964 [Mycoavidus cysteinexigens]|uniref:Uncharacterized protein n=1 Tax=Mycoavidus cysteinexigens TaxID=1553431 RepID=A0A2Z6EVK3_9BURK|nr:Uncharacterized protein MCB1EB_0964 [Mycoavidus cysteinexigens]GLR00211.1 hypothetical protein GCM10007934_00220 [Mycoavidus cysteinexigens]